MPKIATYRQLAPFSMRDLVASANALLRSKPHLEVTDRVVRFYITKGLLRPPEGPPKLAKYSYEHLLALVAVRGLQDRGVNLNRIADDLQPLWGGRTEIVEKVVDEWLQSPDPSLREDRLDEPFQPSLLGESMVRDSYVAPPSQAIRSSYMKTKSSPPREWVSEELDFMRREIDDLRRQLDAALPPTLNESRRSFGHPDREREIVDAIDRSAEQIRHGVEFPMMQLINQVSELAKAVSELTNEIRESRAEQSSTPEA